MPPVKVEVWTFPAYYAIEGQVFYWKLVKNQTRIIGNLFTVKQQRVL